MSQKVSRYKRENGKTRRVKDAAKPAVKNGAAGSSPGADSKNGQPETTAK